MKCGLHLNFAHFILIESEDILCCNKLMFFSAAEGDDVPQIRTILVSPKDGQLFVDGAQQQQVVTAQRKGTVAAVSTASWQPASSEDLLSTLSAAGTYQYQFSC